MPDGKHLNITYKSDYNKNRTGFHSCPVFIIYSYYLCKQLFFIFPSAYLRYDRCEEAYVPCGR